MGIFKKNNIGRACTCGHMNEAHQHYRSGSDCGACGRNVCSKFKAAKQGAPQLVFDARPLVLSGAPVEAPRKEPVAA